MEKEDNRCPKYSLAWNVRCDLVKGHGGLCVSEGDGFYGRIPETVPAPPEQQTAEVRLKKALDKRIQRFEQRLTQCLPERDSFEGKKLSEKRKEEIAISKMRRELMEKLAFSMDLQTSGGLTAELTLFESWVASRKE